MESLLNKDRITSKELVADAYQYLVEKYDRSSVQQLTPASPFIQTLSVLGELSELNFLYIENAISELNIETARNSDNIFGLARLTGHNPTRGFSSRGKIKISLKSNYEDFEGDYLLLPKYTKIKCLNNNLTYLLLPEATNIKIEKSGIRSVECNIIEGDIEVQTFTGLGTKLQSFSVNTNSLTDHYHIQVTVNGETYKATESLYDLTSNEKGVLIKTGITGGLDIYFGNGDFGYIPAQGALIDITYIKTNGTIGNIASRNARVEYDFDSSGYNIFGDEIDLMKTLSIASLMNPNYGGNEEDINFTRLIAPYMSKNFVLVNPDNYYYYFKKFNYFSVISVYNTTEDQYKDDDNIIYMFLVPDLKRKLTSEYDYFSIDLNEFILTTAEKEMLLRLINESGQQRIGHEIKFITPQIKKYVLNIVLSYFDGFNKDVLTTEIHSKLNEYFINVNRRDTIPRSDLIALLKSIDGVDSANVFFISEENEKAMIKGFYTKKVFIYNTTTKKREWIETKKVKLRSTEDPNIGLNEFGDINIEEGDIPVIRGGWKDVNDIYYEEDLNSNLSGLNIFYKGTLDYSVYVKENDKALNSLTKRVDSIKL